MEKEENEKIQFAKDQQESLIESKILAAKKIELMQTQQKLIFEQEKTKKAQFDKQQAEKIASEKAYFEQQQQDRLVLEQKKFEKEMELKSKIEAEQYTIQQRARQEE